MIEISGSLIWSKTLMELIFNPCPVANFGEDRRAQLAKSTLLTSTLVPLGSFQIFKFCSDAKERMRCIPSKTADWVPEFAVEDLPLCRTAALVPEFAAKDLPLGTIF